MSIDTSTEETLAAALMARRGKQVTLTYLQRYLIPHPGLSAAQRSRLTDEQRYTAPKEVTARGKVLRVGQNEDNHVWWVEITAPAIPGLSNNVSQRIGLAKVVSAR